MTIWNCKVLVTSVKVRDVPNTNNTSNLIMLKDTLFQVSEIVPDSLDPTNAGKKWGHILGGVYDGKYTALEYPNNASPISSYIPDTVIPPAPTDPPIVHIYPDVLEVVPVVDNVRYPMKEYIPKV